MTLYVILVYPCVPLWIVFEIEQTTYEKQPVQKPLIFIWPDKFNYSFFVKPFRFFYCNPNYFNIIPAKLTVKSKCRSKSNCVKNEGKVISIWPVEGNDLATLYNYNRQANFLFKKPKKPQKFIISALVLEQMQSSRFN